MANQNRINLIDLYVFVAGCSREKAAELVACYDNDAEIAKTIETYKTCKR